MKDVEEGYATVKKKYDEVSKEFGDLAQVPLNFSH